MPFSWLLVEVKWPWFVREPFVIVILEPVLPDPLRLTFPFWFKKLSKVIWLLRSTKPALKPFVKLPPVETVVSLNISMYPSLRTCSISLGGELAIMPLSEDSSSKMVTESLLVPPTTTSTPSTSMTLISLSRWSVSTPSPRSTISPGSL